MKKKEANNKLDKHVIIYWMGDVCTHVKIMVGGFDGQLFIIGEQENMFHAIFFFFWVLWTSPFLIRNQNWHVTFLSSGHTQKNIMKKT